MPHRAPRRRDVTRTDAGRGGRGRSAARQWPGGSAGGRYWVVDLSTTPPTLVDTLTPASTGAAVFDYVYADGFFWGLTGGQFKRIEAATGEAEMFPVPAGWGLPVGSYGAAWRFGNGNLGFSLNGGTVYQIAVEDPASAAPQFRLVSQQPGPGSSFNDGAGIEGLPTDLSVLKSAPAHLDPGGTITYEFSVTNHGPGVSSGWSVTDAFPASLTVTAVAGDVSHTTLDGALVVSGGRLGVGETRTFTVTADVAPGAPACVSNTAEVMANESDPEPGNNSSTAESCVPELAVTKTSDATMSTRVGDTVTYTIGVTNTGPVDYTVDEPAVVFDDLSDVLGHATYNGDATASGPGDVDYAPPLLSWTGPIPVGETVEITYSVTLTSRGDGTVRNVTWVPEDPTTPVPPACDPPAGGVDPVTGEQCAEHEVLLPALRVTKVADQAALPAAGMPVEYTLTVENVGPGDYTAAAPAEVVDDLTAVLDDATFNDDAVALVNGAAPAPAPTFTEPRLTWSGPLAAGEFVEITYSVTYDASGDFQLRNVACLPGGQVAPGASECAFVQIPAAGLTQWKQVTPSATPAVAGTVLTYDLFFQNDGAAPAAVDAVDDLTYVLDDADVTTAPSSPDGLLVNQVGDRLEITGSVPPGETYRVTYEVTIGPDGTRGDDVATNFLLDPGDSTPPTPDCTPTDPAFPFPQCTTTVPAVHDDSGGRGRVRQVRDRQQ